ncbi:hypothetical protein [Nocardia sp. NPDC052566]|uniref:hypothetical protein n=1 Tax=Nocardia sp. NPDC052566 TaxID=3364330 RepID=UPI0037CA77BB
MGIAVGAVVLTGAALVAIMLWQPTSAPSIVDAGPSATAAPPTTTSTLANLGACAGLSGTTVTDGDGRPDSLTGVIVAFERAYYAGKLDAALKLLAPDTGIAAEGLAAGMASIPAGTRHCVAITAIAETAARVHVAELRADGQRMDYLQLINIRVTGGTAVITNIQNQA